MGGVLPPAVPAETDELLARVENPAAVTRPGVQKSLLPVHGLRVRLHAWLRNPPGHTGSSASTSSSARHEASGRSGSRLTQIEGDGLLRYRVLHVRSNADPQRLIA